MVYLLFLNSNDSRHSNLNPMASTFVPSWQREDVSNSNSNSDTKSEISNSNSVSKTPANIYSASVFDILPTELLYALFAYLPGTFQ